MPPSRLSGRLPGRGGQRTHSGNSLDIIAKVRRARVLTRAPHAQQQRRAKDVNAASNVHAAAGD
tara:strand:- start:1607 stop:1798 length:192 start_codon:yes stop_codon:yes gene_type:complete